MSRRLVAALLGSVAVARAEVPAFAPDVSDGVRFHADRLELDPRLERLELRGHVVVTVDRYRLTSEQLEVRRGPTGVAIDGPGVVAFCGCSNPPLTFGFQSALVAPPTDLVLRQPTVRVADVPVLWLPYLWLRSPRRIGAMPLRLAFRGEDGLLLGSGLHVPIASDSEFELGIGAYVKGGAEVETRLTTPRTSSVIRWDYLREGSVSADLRGSAISDEGANAAWSVDALRGARALRGPALLEEVALRQDRARAAVGWSDGTVVAGMLASADAIRGQSATTFGAVGPGAYAGLGGALASVGTGDLDVGVATLRDSSTSTTTLVSEHGRLRTEWRAGPVSIAVGGDVRGTATLGEGASGHAAASGVSAELSLPVVKEFGSPSAELQHWVTPFVTGTTGFADSRAPSVAPAIADNGGFFVASGGVRSTLGESAGDRGAVSVSARGGYLGEQGRSPTRAFAWTAGGRARFVSMQGEGILLADAPVADVTLLQLRVGAVDGPFIAARSFEQNRSVPLLGRMFVGGSDAPWIPWLSPLAGWSAGGGLGVPVTRWLMSTADLDYDVTSHALLGLRGTLRYRHPCGCLGVTVWAGHRAGRTGLDSWLTLDLAP